MKIKMLTLCAGPDGVMESGQVYDVTPAKAKQLIDGRYAVAVEAEKPAEKIETAAVPVEVPEKAVIEPPAPVSKLTVEKKYKK